MIFRGIELFRAEGDLGNTWHRAEVVIGRVPGKFKIQFNARLQIKEGGGAIALDDINFDLFKCAVPVKSFPSDFDCKMKNNTYHCHNAKFCYDEDKV